MRRCQGVRGSSLGKCIPSQHLVWLVNTFSFKLPQNRLARFPIAVMFAFAVAAFSAAGLGEREAWAIGDFEKYSYSDTVRKHLNLTTPKSIRNPKDATEVPRTVPVPGVYSFKSRLSDPEYVK